MIRDGAFAFVAIFSELSSSPDGSLILLVTRRTRSDIGIHDSAKRSSILAVVRCFRTYTSQYSKHCRTDGY
jgi:hypothetical protein